MEDIRTIEQQFRNQQEKFVYYIIALSVAVIGFSIHLTTGQPYKWSQIILGLSTLSFCLSVLCGFRYLKKLLEFLSFNRKYLINKSQRELPREEEEYISEEKSIFQKKTTSLWNCMYRLFFLGVFLFLIWHLTDMFFTTIII
jgi:uncharacterized membrane protein